MAVGTNENRSLFYLKIQAKKDNQVDPHFKMTQAQGKGKPVKELPGATFVTGKIKDVENSSYKWEDEIVKTVKITMTDGDEMYVIDSSYTQLLRGLLNCLANIEVPGFTKISLYTSKSGYASVWVEIDGEASGFKHQWESLKPMIRVYQDGKGKDQNDYSKMDEFYAKQVEELIGPKFRNAYTEEVPTEVPAEAHVDDSIKTKDVDISSELPDTPEPVAETPQPTEDEGESGLPF